MPGFLQQFERDFSDFPTTKNPAWIRELRVQGRDQFARQGFPTTRQEEWRYTNVDPLTKIPFRFLSQESVPKAALDSSEDLQIVFVNGRYAPKLSLLRGLPRGALVLSLEEAFKKFAGSVEPYLARHASFKEHPFVALNTAFLKDGAFVYLPKGTILETPIHLIYCTVTDNDGPSLVSYPRNLIVAEMGSQATVVESYVGQGKGVYWTNAVTEMVLGEASLVEHTKLQFEGEGAYHTADLSVYQGNQSRLISHSISLGGSLCRNDMKTLLDAEGAECALNGLYLVSGTQHVDNHTVIDHAKPHATSLELYKGILGGKAQGVFNGQIIVRADASKTNARQTNKNLLLSEGAVINTKPLLEILNNDVKCNHGATIGRLDQTQVFYLRSRGLGDKEARGLLTYAFAGEVLAKMKVASIRHRLREMLSSKLMAGDMDPPEEDAA